MDKLVNVMAIIMVCQIVQTMFIALIASDIGILKAKLNRILNNVKR